ncbi:MAG: IS256 family transposase [Myxococcota bacterium]
MPTKPNKTAEESKTPKPTKARKPRKRTKRTRTGETLGFKDELLDQLLGDYQSPEDMIGESGLLKKLTAALVTRAMAAEMAEHIGYDKGERPPEGTTNRRNGQRTKRLRSDQGEFEVAVPRDREGSFEPQLVPKHSREFRGFDDKILAMYARGMSVRDIRASLAEMYGVDVSRDLISRVTDAVLDELRAWQTRPLEAVYPVAYIDALVVKIRHHGRVEKRAVHVAVGLRLDGRKEVLGLWIAEQEGAKFWLSVMTELKQRGLEDIFILCADGLSGLPNAIEATYPKAVFQTCVVHLIRASTRYVTWKHRRELCKDLKAIYGAPSEEAAREGFDAFSAKWKERCPLAVKTWEENWDRWTPFLGYPAEIRRVIYTTNSIEALNRILRKTLKTRGALPSDDAALKLIFLAVQNAKSTWGKATRSWSKALVQFAILFEDRMPA